MKHSSWKTKDCSLVIVATMVITRWTVAFTYIGRAADNPQGDP